MGEAAAALDGGAVRIAARGAVGHQIDGDDAELGQRLRLAVDHHPEIGKARVARVQLSVVIGVEHAAQRLHVAAGARIPIREDDLAAL
ncbi:hypothetical protein [uncultured Alsobacter sp.]|uniref:hypothetical protein n=1 Tax=uncultured Alsobacter sp. TaxID=1748258 RepID=UPI0025E65763|nr:hypothetical protein [uncultured Alsobacter sp.]